MRRSEWNHNVRRLHQAPVRPSSCAMAFAVSLQVNRGLLLDALGLKTPSNPVPNAMQHHPEIRAGDP